MLDAISVVIPTYNRKDILKECLESLFIQTYPKDSYEIIVVDDGSVDGTEGLVRLLIDKSSVALRYFRQENRGPASARNVGIRNANSRIIMFIGDDIISTANLLEKHFESHRHYVEDSVAVLGYVTWSPRTKSTNFMEWLEDEGGQFGYPLIRNQHNVPYNFFYTSNISVKRQFLLKYGLFDESFPYAAYEDIELGYRLQKVGLKIIYNNRAVGYHNHLVDMRSFNKRSRFIGISMAIFHQKHPELKDKLIYNNFSSVLKYWIVWHFFSFVSIFIHKKFFKNLGYRYMFLYYVGRGHLSYLK